MEIELNEYGQKFILIFFRIVSVMWLLPFFSSQSVSVTFKVGFSLLLAFLLFPVVNVPAGMAFQADPYLFLLLVLKELLIGLAVGFVVRILFLAVAVAGEIPALQAGFAFARFMDPSTMMQVSVLEKYKNILAVMIFFAVDAHLIVIRNLAASFREVPLGSIVFRESLVFYLVNVTTKIFTVSMKIGAPVIVTLFLTEVALGVLSRMIPQINIFVEGVPMKIMITFLVLALSLNFIVPVIANHFRGIDMEMIKIFQLTK